MTNFNKKVNLLNKLYFQGDISFQEYKNILNTSESKAKEYLGDTEIKRFLPTTLHGATLIKPQVFLDERGFFMESYSEIKYLEAGINKRFIQDNHSLSVDKGVLRGLHFQRPPFAQAKLVRVLKGSVYDVIVDLRQDSPTFLKWEGFKLTSKNQLLLYIPKGFAHAFCTLEDNTEFFYKVDAPYNKDSEDGIIWNDKDLNINWPIDQAIISRKDKVLPTLNNLDNPF